MHFSRFFTTVAILGTAVRLALGVDLPFPLYSSGYVGLDSQRRFMIGIYDGNDINGQLTAQQLADLAYLAGSEVRSMALGNPNLLASGRSPGTVAVWQDEDMNVYIASSDASYTFDGHAERNIITATNNRIRGGRVISFTWRGNTLGIRAACGSCIEEITNHLARDAYRPGMIPRSPPIPNGWSARWYPRETAYEYTNAYSCSVTVWDVPRTANVAPTLPQGWFMEYSPSHMAYYYYVPNNANIPAQWTIPTQSITPPSNRRSPADSKTPPKEPAVACPWSPKTKAPDTKSTATPAMVSLPQPVKGKSKSSASSDTTKEANGTTSTTKRTYPHRTLIGRRSVLVV